MIRRMAMLSLAALLSACATSATSVLIGDKMVYPQTAAKDITLIMGAPERSHSTIALVEGVAATDDYFTTKRTEAAAISAMKKEAGRIGAHAIVITGKATTPYGQDIGSTPATGTSSGYNRPSDQASYTANKPGWEKITFSGTAIRYEAER